jgi:CO/xanthine dehydrogenase Mo-binding subunit
VGCYPNPHAIGAILLGSYYQIPNLDVTYTEVMTHKVSTAAYRAPATPQATFALESVVDEVARRLQLDPFELRLRHASQTGIRCSMTGNGATWGCGRSWKPSGSIPLWQNREEARQQGGAWGWPSAAGRVA